MRYQDQNQLVEVDDRDEGLTLAKLKAIELLKRTSRRAGDALFPENDVTLPDGSLIHARSGYQKQLEFFAAGRTYRERCFMAANRVGKTVGGGFETKCHLTGHYPTWWPGRRFSKPVRLWACGKTNESTRDIVQNVLLGDIAYPEGTKGFTGMGLVPGHAIGKATWKQGVADLADTVQVKHITGGWSTLGLKSYAQKRGAFEGTAQHAIWLDEEPPIDIYGECLIRTTTTNGIIYLTFTPLDGITETVLQFLPADMRPDGFEGTT
jgi:phage terminase large subunit-like protein